MKVKIANASYRLEVGEDHHVDITVYSGKWTTEIEMDVWRKGKPESLAYYCRRYINWERILPLGIAERLTRRNLVNHERELKRRLLANGYCDLNFDIIEEESK